MNSKLALLFLAVLIVSNCQINWNDQDNWSGNCNNDSFPNQSPINIVTKDVEYCPEGY